MDREELARLANFAVVASFGAHFGEERPLVGIHGSGTIFFFWCNMGFVYCQNSDISQQGSGREVSSLELAGMMLNLQAQGCHNINLVSPSHVVPQILDALLIVVQKGLNNPIVCNSGGYNALDTLKLLDSVIDIYMPDMKYADNAYRPSYQTIQSDRYPELGRRTTHQEYQRAVQSAIKAGLRRLGE